MPDPSGPESLCMHFLYSSSRDTVHILLCCTVCAHKAMQGTIMSQIRQHDIPLHPQQLQQVSAAAVLTHSGLRWQAACRDTAMQLCPLYLALGARHRCCQDH